MATNDCSMQSTMHSGKKKYTKKITNYAPERKINRFELIPEVFSMPSSPLADQTRSLPVLAFNAEAGLEFKGGEAERCVRQLEEGRILVLGWRRLSVSAAWLRDS